MRSTTAPLAAIVFATLLWQPARPSLSADRDDRPSIATMESTGPFKPELKQAEILPSGAIQISGEPMRDWKDSLGNSIRGRLVGMHGATVVLMVEGEPLFCALAGFSNDDRQYVRSALQSRGKSHLFPGATAPDSETAALRLIGAQWPKQLGTWVRAVNSPDPKEPNAAEEAIICLRSVRDPAALPHLTTLISKESNAAVRAACIEAVAGIGGPEATRLLVKLSATDRNGPVRASANWSLCQQKDSPLALAEYAKYLRTERYRDSALLSLQATGLVRKPNSDQTPDSQLTDALISTLIVKETRYEPYTEWWGYYWTMLRSGGLRGGGHFRWEMKLARFEVPVPREIARRMLVEYTGEDFGYDRQAWRKWQATVSETPKPSPDSISAEK